MPTLLRIDASPRGVDAHSWRLADALMQRLLEREPDLRVIRRQLAGTPVIDGTYANAMVAHQTREASAVVPALTHSETLIGELEQSDRLLISTPMHNYTVPAALKVWIDQVVRVGRTFRSTPEGKIGVLADRPTWVVMSSGGYVTGERARQPDFLTGYLTAILATLGIRDVTFFPLEGLNRGPAALEEAYRTAREKVAATLG